MKSQPNPEKNRDFPPRQPLWLRVLRVLAAAGLSFAVSILLVIVLLAKVPMMRDVVFSFYYHPEISQVGFTGLALLVALFLPLAVIIYGLRHRWFSWRVLAAVWALVIGFMINLAIDEPVLNLPANADEFAPILPGDVASSQVLLRYSPSNVPEFKLDPSVISLVANLNGTNKDTDVLRQHHDEIEAGWLEIAVLREWFAELAALPRIGDLYQRPTDAIPAFSPIRTYSRFACAHAEILALDGKGDEALATLRQLMDVSQKMSASSRTLVRIMISIVIEKMALARAAYVLDNATTSPAARAEFAATLAKGVSGAAGARRMIMVEYVMSMVPSIQDNRFDVLAGTLYSASDTIPARLKRPIEWLDPLLMNPLATLNLAGRYYSELADLAAKRDMVGCRELSAQLGEEWGGRVPVKNIGGRMIISVAFPAFTKVTEQYWQEQDENLAMQARLKAVNSTISPSGAH